MSYVIVVDHRAGCFHAHSPDVPGFHLCADSSGALKHDIAAALAFFFQVKTDAKKGHSTETDKTFELLEHLMQRQSKKYVVVSRPSINTKPLKLA